jgi:HK97 gp10 family phage protein
MHVEFDMSVLSDMARELELQAEELDKNLKVAIKEGAKVAQQGMKRRVPKDTHNLEKNIHIDTAKIESGSITIEVGLMRKGTYKVDDDTARYGNVLEYGTADQQARSYIRATMLEDQDKIFQAVFDSLKSQNVLGMSEDSG